MRLLSVALALSLAFSAEVFAQPTDTLLVLVDGREVRGMFVEKTADAYVVRVDGAVVKYQFSDVARMARTDAKVKAQAEVTPTFTSGIVEQLTPALINEAIAIGARPTAKKFLEGYQLRPRSGAAPFTTYGSPLAVFSTPFSRVVALSLDAHERYAKITPADIDQAVLAPEIEVHAWPTVVSARMTGDIANVRAVVLTPARSTSRADAIQPLRTSNAVTTYSNLFGAIREGASLTAVFPIAEFRAGRDVHVVFDQRVNVAGLNYCDDCRVEIKLTGLR